MRSPFPTLVAVLAAALAAAPAAAFEAGGRVSWGEAQPAGRGSARSVVVTDDGTPTTVALRLSVETLEDACEGRRRCMPLSILSIPAGADAADITHVAMSWQSAAESVELRFHGSNIRPRANVRLDVRQLDAMRAGDAPELQVCQPVETSHLAGWVPSRSCVRYLAPADAFSVSLEGFYWRGTAQGA